MKRLSSLILIVVVSINGLVYGDDSIVINPNSSAQKEVIAIIGGGMTGVAASIFLKDSPFEIHLFEKQPHLGGHAQTRIVPSGISNGNGESEVVNVDIGPQYFAPGGWDTYIDFLKHFDLYHESERILFSPSIAIYPQSDFTKSQPIHYKPYFVSPRKIGGLKRAMFSPRNLVRSINLLRFLLRGFNIYNNNSKYLEMTVGDWLKTLPFTQYYKENVLKPLIVSVSNTTIESVENVSLIYMVQALAFRHPLDNKFFVSQVGIGSIIQTLGQKALASNSNLHYHMGSPVMNVQTEGNKFKVTNEAGFSVVADKVIFATHPFQAAKILQNTKGFSEIIPILKDFTYLKLDLALHTDKRYVRTDLDSFFNIGLSPNGKDFSLTMNLSTVHPKYGNILKSWIFKKEDLEKLKKESYLITSAEYDHPIVTPKFLKLQVMLNEKMQAIPNVKFIGGWTSFFESQNTTILSAFKTAKELMSPESLSYWTKNMTTLTDENLAKVGLDRKLINLNLDENFQVEELDQSESEEINSNLESSHTGKIK
jgi:predicted NAD/FAD-binding protein